MIPAMAQQAKANQPFGGRSVGQRPAAYSGVYFTRSSVERFTSISVTFSTYAPLAPPTCGRRVACRANVRDR